MINENGIGSSNRVILWIVLFFLIISLQTMVAAQEKVPKMTLTIGIDEEYNPDFKVCMPIEVDVPFTLEMTRGRIKSGISGVLVTNPEGKLDLTLKMELGPIEEFTSQETVTNEIEPEK